MGLLFAAAPADAQLRTLKSSYSLSSDTVTDAGTTYIQSICPGSAITTTIFLTVVKQSGTVAGTITLQGSMDGTTYKALNAIDSQTALATITAANASGNYSWRLHGNPYLYYRVSWTGTGTMAATIAGVILSR